MHRRHSMSFTKSGEIYVSVCNESEPLFPTGTDPATWSSCEDAYEFTWNLDLDNDILALSTLDRAKLARSMGFCPHNRCQLGNLTSTKDDGRCPQNLCYTKLENGARSYGACCFIEGAFNSGQLIGYNDKTQNTPKPIYKRSRVILGDRIGGADESYDAFINANLIHKGIIAMQCPLESTVLDTQRMFVEQNVSLWIQLAPYKDTATGTVPIDQQCKITPTDFVQHAAAHNSTLLSVTDYVQLPNMQLGIQNPSFNVHAFDVHLTSLTAGVTRTQRVTNVWYKQWQDFEIPAAGDTQDMVRLAELAAGTVRGGGTVAVSCLSGRGRTGTLAAMIVGRLQEVRSHGELVEAIVQMREHRDGLLELPSQYRFVATALGLPDPAVCGALCAARRSLDQHESYRLFVALLSGAALVIIPVLYMLRKVKI